MRKPVVGEKLFSLNVGNAARRCHQVLTPMWVVSVGRKYFKVSANPEQHNAYRDVQFRIDNWCENTEYSSGHALYETEQEWIDEKASSAICGSISSAFEYGKNRLGITIEDLCKIESIINTYDTGEEQ